MTEDEKIAMIKLLRQLPKQKQREFYYMVKGAAFAAKKTKTAQEEQHDQHDFDSSNSWLGGLQYSFENCYENHKGFFTNERHQANR